MTSIAVLGVIPDRWVADITRKSLSRDRLSVLVRSPSKLPPEVAAWAQVLSADLVTVPSVTLAQFAEGHDVLVSCAGVVTEGERFVAMVDRIVSAIESLPSKPVPCVGLAGAALLDLHTRGRRGVDLPKVRNTYWPHRANLERLLRSDLDWRLLCPGPMVDQPAIGIDRLRISIASVPARSPAFDSTPACATRSAVVCRARARDDRSVRRRRFRDARRRRSRWPHVTQARWTCSAGWNAG